MPTTLTIGVISDTHGKILPGVKAAFKGVDRILHAGDIDKPHILNELEKIAPTTAVRGNMDSEDSFHMLPKQTTVTLGAITALIVHDLNRLPDLILQGSDISLIISGHTHRPHWEQCDGKYFLNPGSACSPRGGGNPSVAILTISGTTITHRQISI